MSKVCQFTGAKPKSGHNVSHSNRKTNRRFMPNLIKKTLTDEKTGTKIKVKITARALRTYTKNPKKFTEQIKGIVKKTLKKLQK